MTTDTAHRLGDRFAELMAEDISPTAMHTIRLRNASPEYAGDICATHDFCDANMVMLEAFEQVIGREPAFLEGTDEAGNHSPQGEADMLLWNAAWSHAKAAHLTATAAEVEATTKPADGSPGPAGLAALLHIPHTGA